MSGMVHWDMLGLLGNAGWRHTFFSHPIHLVLKGCAGWQSNIWPTDFWGDQDQAFETENFTGAFLNHDCPSQIQVTSWCSVTRKRWTQPWKTCDVLGSWPRHGGTNTTFGQCGESIWNPQWVSGKSRHANVLKNFCRPLLAEESHGMGGNDLCMLMLHQFSCVRVYAYAVFSRLNV